MNHRSLFLTALLSFAIISFSFIDNPKKARKNEAIARSFIEAWSEHDADKLLSLFDEHCLYEEVASGRKFKDKEGIKAYLENTIQGTPDSEFKVVSIIANEDMATVEWVWKATNTVGWEAMGIPATNKYFEVRGVSVMTIKKNLIWKCSDYWDWGTFMKGIGVN
jgi:steroid delta-isomerase-like uncharacterized protein